MDRHSTATAEALRWLGIAEKLLASRDLLGSKTFAIRARDSDPRLEIADQILAVIDILLAGEKRINNHPDLYAILQLGHPTHDLELIASHYRRLVLLLNPNRTRLAFADQAFNLVLDAWSVLSNPTRKSLYDNELTLHFNFFPNPLGSGPTREQEFLQSPPPPPQPQQLQQQEQQSRRSPKKSNIFQAQPTSGNNLITGFGPYHPPPPQPQPQPPPPAPQLQQPEEQQSRRSPRRNNIFQAQPISGDDEITGFGPTRVQEYQTSPPPPPPQQTQPQPEQQTRQSPKKLDISETQPSSGNREKIATLGRPTQGKQNKVPSIWTACPYCYNMYEYPKVYAECTLLCQNCRRAFQAVVISSPPPILDGKEAYFCSWGYFPIGVSMPTLQKGKGGASKWTPFSPMFTCPEVVGKEDEIVPKNRKSSAPRIYIDDDDIFVGVSESSEESDDEWGSTRKRKKGKSVKGKGSTGRTVKNTQADKGKNVKGGTGENSQTGFVVQDSVSAPNVSVAESSKKVSGTNARKQPGRVAKDWGRLDLNVEFSNEAEESAAGNKAGHGEVDNIEGIGFFEGLDEFLSSLPILSVVGDDKVKAA